MPKFLLIVNFLNVFWENTRQVAPQVVDQIERFETQAGETEKSSSGSQRLSRNAWLLDAKNSWHRLQQLVDLAQTCKFSYSVLLAEGEVTHMNEPLPNVGEPAPQFR